MNKKQQNFNSNSALLRSVSTETKDRFDNLLKKAVVQNDKTKKNAQNVNKSNIEKSLKTKKETKIENALKQNDAVQLKIQKNINDDNENYILDKFLSDSVHVTQENSTIHPELLEKLHNAVTFIKTPVPLPRQGKTKTDHSPVSNSSSSKTYNIVAPRVNNVELPEAVDKTSDNNSNRTYSVKDQENQVLKNVARDKRNNKTKISKNAYDDSDNKSNSSGGTYNVYKNREEGSEFDSRKYNTRNASVVSSSNEIVLPVGDILLHNNSGTKKLVNVINRKKETVLSEKSSTDQAETSSQVKKKITKKDSSKKSSTSNEPQDKNTSVSNAAELVKEDGTQTPKIKSIGDQKKQTVKRKSKQKFKKKTSSNETSLGNDIELVPENTTYTYDDLIGIVIYKTDKLLLNSLINHPCVKVHIVDGTTGEYLRRTQALIDDVSQASYINPLITRAYNLQEKRSLIPQWQELIVFQEDFNRILQYKNSIIIFFELLDFLSFEDASLKYTKEGSSSGWHKVAWAFLKPITAAGRSNMDKNVRLQLYKPQKCTFKKGQNFCMLFDWWSSENLVKYPSTLYVSVRRVKANGLNQEKQSVVLSALTLDTQEIENYEENNAKQMGDIQERCDEEQKKDKGLSDQICKIPNWVKARFKSGIRGCFAVSFSNRGLLLACGLVGDSKFPIILYWVESSAEYCKFSGHLGLIYDFHWTQDDRYLISASADRTAYIWDVANKTLCPKQVLPHPSFVYCAKFGVNDSEIATGCYDKVIRIWKSSNGVDSDYSLMQELVDHKGYITSICFPPNEQVLYSADSVGVITEWIIENDEWKLQRRLKFKEFQSMAVNKIQLHPKANRLLIFCRDSIHRMIDLNIGCMSQWYRGSLNCRVQLSGCISPCGNLVIAPSEDGLVFVWNADTGVLQATLNPYSIIKEPVIAHSVCYHPVDNLIAVCHYGESVPIILCAYDKSCTGAELQLKNCTDVQSTVREKLSSSKTKRVTVYNKSNVISGRKNVNLHVIMEKIDQVLESANT